MMLCPLGGSQASYLYYYKQETHTNFQDLLIITINKMKRKSVPKTSISVAPYKSN